MDNWFSFIRWIFLQRIEGMVIMDYPCKDCIVKGICKIACNMLMRVREGDELVLFININGRCPDCGHTTGIRYNGIYIGIMECTECYTSFLPTMSQDNILNLLRLKKGKTTLDGRHKNLMTFSKYIEELIRDNRRPTDVYH
jgi:hypothetical protein